MSGISPEEVVEFKHGLAGLAELCHAFYGELQNHGFSDFQAMMLTSTWLEAVFIHGAQSLEEDS